LDCICLAINRAALSTPPPAANGTINLIVPSGNFVCADANAVAVSNAMDNIFFVNEIMFISY
jgi:hypothetical protein